MGGGGFFSSPFRLAENLWCAPERVRNPTPRTEQDEEAEVARLTSALEAAREERRVALADVLEAEREARRLAAFVAARALWCQGYCPSCGAAENTGSLAQSSGS